MSDKMSNQHAGHRVRFRKRYLDSAGEGFSDHELIELLLFYAIPRGNTNGIAHDLIERFSTVNAIAEASIDELKLVDGIGDNSAILIKLVMSLAKKYAESYYKETKRIESLQELVSYANHHTMGAVKELVYGVFMDDNLNVLGTNIIASGTINEVKPMLRTIFELCLLKRATSFALFHNHPNGGVEASAADVEFTLLLERELKIIGVTLLEHVIVDGISYTPILKSINDDYEPWTGRYTVEELMENYY